MVDLLLLLLLFFGGGNGVLKWSLNGSKMIPNGPKTVPNGPPPIPIPGGSKSLLPGGKQIGKNKFKMIFNDFYENCQK